MFWGSGMGTVPVAAQGPGGAGWAETVMFDWSHTWTRLAYVCMACLPSPSGHALTLLTCLLARPAFPYLAVSFHSTYLLVCGLASKT